MPVGGATVPFSGGQKVDSQYSLGDRSQSTDANWPAPTITRTSPMSEATAPGFTSDRDNVRGNSAKSWPRSADFRRWGIRPKLIAVVIIPTVAALLLGGVSMRSALGASASYSRLGSLAGALPDINDLVDALQNERDLTAGLLAARTPASLASLTDARRRVDDAVTAVRNRVVVVDTSRDRTLLRKIQNVVASLDGLSATRRGIELGAAAAATVSASYTAMIQGLLAVSGELSAQSHNGEVARRAIGLDALASAKEAASRQRATLYGALQAGAFHGGGLTDFVAANARQQDGIATFLADTTPAGQDQYRSVVSGATINAVDDITNQVLRTQSTKGLAVSPAQWFAASSDQIARIGRVQTDQVSALTDRIHSLSASARQGALASAGIIYLILGFALLATLLVARSILRPLQKLRSGALSVAYEELPDSVRQLQDGDATGNATEVKPILAERYDEIGEVARAFDAVHSEALHLAGEQALMRGNVSKMFINLSRRSQSLVERQLRLIDELEATEQDADQLANLFRLDHLATRMRRNDESLLVLAGADGGRRRNDRVAMVDVLRAATAEVEQYSRVAVDPEPGCWLAGTAANDVVHLLAELIENATTFSSPNTKVWLRSTSVAATGEVLIELEDQGIGMSAEELAAANERLATASTLDVAMSPLMGLFVVARLAQRHRIQVQLHAAPAGGVIALVRVPAELTVMLPEFEHAMANGTTSPESDTVWTPDMAESPIFFTLQSEWFTRRIPDGNALENGAKAVLALEPTWESPGDEGWRAAAALAGPQAQPDEVTEAGLPVRLPGRNLVPGSVSAPAVTAEPGPAVQTEPNPARTLSSFQDGVQRARAAADPSDDRGPSSPDDQEA